MEVGLIDTICNGHIIYIKYLNTVKKNGLRIPNPIFSAYDHHDTMYTIKYLLFHVMAGHGINIQGFMV